MAVADKVTVELELRDQQYNARLKSSEREFKRSMDATERAAEEAARDINRTMGQLPDDLRRKYRDLGTDIGRSFAGASRAAQVAFAAITAYSLNAARKAEDINDAFAFTFSQIGTDADKAAERISGSFNRTSTQVKEGLNNAYQILTGVGLDSERAFTASQEIVSRSIDLASQKGISDARAYQAIISGLTGESEPLKALGVVINETTVGLELQRLGFKGSTSEASEAQKMLARYNLILAKTNTAQGDVARTSESANNKLKEAQTEFENAAVALGTELLPAFVKVTGAATDMLRAFNELPDGVQTASLGFLAFIAATGPVAGMLANLGKVIKLAKDTRNALLLLGATGGAGAVGRGAAAGIGSRVAGGLLGTTGGAIGATLLLGGDTNNRPQTGQARVNAQLAEEARVRGEIVRLTNQGRAAEAARQQAYLTRVTARRLSEQPAPQIAGLREGLSSIATGVDTSVVAGFGLGGLGNTGNGGSGGGSGRGRAGSSDDPLRELRADLARIQEGALTDAERAAKDLSDTLKTIDDAVKNRLLTPVEGRILGGAVASEDLSRPDPIVLESLGTEARDIGKQMAEGFAEQQKVFADQGADAARAFVDIVRSENIGESIGYAFQDAAFNNIEKYLGQIFSTLFQGSGSGGIGSIVSSFFGFGGGRAAGGPVRAGFAYDVGENGREKFIPKTDGFIMPNMGAQAKSVGSQSINIRQSFDLTGVSGDAAIYSNVSRMIAQGQRQTLAIANSKAPEAQLRRRLLEE